MWRATLAIQKIIQVMSATAAIDRIPPIASWASNVSVLGPKVRIAPNPIETRTAMATPAHTQRRRSRRSIRTRYARRMPTTSEASRPSRRPIR